ncbi:MAG TPA: sulfotransferase family protein [Phycisphaerae bacterium]|nr:sulfotransferase family protein [Phycisphaerae bacterium]
MFQADFITIVSGLPRSGTSMMMSMLEAGGVPVLADGIRTADDDNPKGYYEFERVKKIKDDKAWLPEAKGKVVKMISQLLLDLPEGAGHDYRVIFMRRSIGEILASQKQMMVRRGTVKEGGPSDEEMGKLLLGHVDVVLKKMGSRADVDLIEVDYNAVMKGDQSSIPRINKLLGGGLNTQDMGAVVDKNLYRQRKD